MNARDVSSREAGAAAPVVFRRRAWPLVIWLLLLALVVTPAFAAPLRQDPVPTGAVGNGDGEEPTDEYQRPKGGEPPVDLGPPPAIVDEQRLAGPAVEAARPALLLGTAADLPSYDEEAIASFDVDNAYEMVRYLSVDIGPRVCSTPQELEAAQYLGGILQSYGFEVTIQSFDRTATVYAARVTSPSVELPGGPNWQMRASSSAKITGDSDPVQAEVVYAGTGQSPTDFPPNTAGKIVVMDYSTDATIRNTAVVNAVALGAVGVILARTGANQAPPGNFTLTTLQDNVPVVGGGRAHLDWINELLAAGPLTLRLATNRYVNMSGVNLVGVKRAVDDPGGTTAPIVMVGGHLDSVLGGPGANDNATAPAAALEMARVIGQYSFDKEIRVVAWGGEESGLLGSRAYANALSAAERARFVGYWNMDMMATPYTEDGSGLWAHTTDGLPNFVTQSAYEAAARIGFTNIDGCRDTSGSDHASFSRIGIPSAFFIWEAHYKPAPPDTCATLEGTYHSEPQYHRPNDTMDNVSPERLEIVLQVVGGSVFHSALNAVTLSASDYLEDPIVDATVRADCGEGWRNLGDTDSNGSLETAIPHATCDFTVTTDDSLAVSRLDDVEVFGDVSLEFPPPPVLDPFVEPDPVLLYGSASAYPNVIYTTYELDSASCDPVDTGSVGAKRLTCTATDVAGNTATAYADYHVTYGFAGFFDPVDNRPDLNTANSGRAIPLKWRLTDAYGQPVYDLASVVVTTENLSCSVKASAKAVEEYAAGKSGLQNLGDGYYQFNWQTPKGYARSCKTMKLDLGEGAGLEHTALFRFTN